MPSDLDPSHNAPIFSVGEISQALKLTVEEAFQRVRVRGEISGFKRAASGHLYFTLKDSDAVLDSVCWRGTAGRLGLAPEDGMEVIATGRLTTYPGRSKYQIVIESLELAGEGALLKLLEERKRKLAAEGLFDPEGKRDLPFLPEVIGVVTSPTGAVIRDILHRLADRFPCRVILWPVLVQGEGAAEQIAEAVRGFGDLEEDGPIPRPDLLIVGRGGGSLEDLWAFNEEEVVRAIAECPIPVISAVGHETDTTLADFAADRRAPTPTGAAEMAVPVRIELLAQVMDDGARLTNATTRLLEERRMRLDGLARGLPDPRRVVEDMGQRLDDWSERLGLGLRGALDKSRARLQETVGRLPDPRQQIFQAESRLASESRAFVSVAGKAVTDNETKLTHTARMLESLSYERTLERGYAVVWNEDGSALVTSARAVKPGRAMTVEFGDGKAGVVGTGGGTTPPPRKPRKRKADDDGRQGSLL